jgi:hypothetical protein
MANDSASSPIKPYQQIIASGSGAVLTALFMTLDIHKRYTRSKNDSSFFQIIEKRSN